MKYRCSLFVISILALTQGACNMQDPRLRNVKAPILGKDVRDKHEEAALGYQNIVEVKPPCLQRWHAS